MAARRATVAGTSAYELERIGAIPEIPLERPRAYPEERQREQVDVRPETRDKIDEKARRRAREKARRGQYVSVFAIVGAVAAAVMICYMLVLYTQLTVITDETLGLETQLEEIENDIDSLSIEYDEAFNIEKVEEYARNILGMSEPVEGQILYLEDDRDDEAMILDQEATKDFGILSAITSFFNSLVE